MDNPFGYYPDFQWKVGRTPAGVARRETNPATAFEALGSEARAGRTPLQLFGDALRLTPIVGDALSVSDGVEAAANGDWLGAGLGALGALPFVPGILRAARPTEAFDRAYNMHLDNKPAGNIWQETGMYQSPQTWGIGKDINDLEMLPRQWMEEIPDRNVRLTSRGQTALDTSTDVRPVDTALGRFLEHPQLFDEFPQLRNVEVRAFPDLNSSTRGSAIIPSTGFGSPSIWINAAESNNKIGTLLHEVEHIIQNWESRNFGTSPRTAQQQVGPQFSRFAEDPFTAYRWNSGEAEARAVARRFENQDYRPIPLRDYDLPNIFSVPSANAHLPSGAPLGWNSVDTSIGNPFLWDIKR